MLAYEIGIKTDKKDAVNNIILAEKSFVYFDTHDFKQAGELMNKLAAVNYKFIDEQDKSWLLMQEGYLLFLDKKYEDSEQYLVTRGFLSSPTKSLRILLDRSG